MPSMCNTVQSNFVPSSSQPEWPSILLKKLNIEFMHQTPPPLAALTALRFLTALHVFLFHVEAAKIQFPPQILRVLSSIGFIGVNWFFVLSGFILTYAYAKRRINLASFWRARFVRVFPAYFASLCVALPFFLYVCFQAPQSPENSLIAEMREHFRAFTFLAFILMQSWVPLAAFSVNPVGWSLSVEAFFYFLFPILLPVFAKFPRKVLLTMLIGLSVASIGMGLWYERVIPDGVAKVTYDMNHLTWLNVLRFNPLVRLPEFLIGLIGALLFLQGVLSPKWATPLIATGLIALATATIFSDRIPYPIIHNGLLSLPFLAIIYGTALRPSWIRILEWRTFQKLGEMSYSFFLTHGFVIALFFRPDIHQAQSRSIFEVMTCLVAALVLAYIFYIGIEQPARRRFSPKKVYSGNHTDETQEKSGSK
jgi:peptidoglycan/LPS O-acetylase OafA/YrhL